MLTVLPLPHRRGFWSGVVKVSTDFVARNGKSKMAEMQLKRPDLAVKSLMCEQSRSGVTVRSAHRAGQSRII